MIWWRTWPDGHADRQSACHDDGEALIRGKPKGESENRVRILQHRFIPSRLWAMMGHGEMARLLGRRISGMRGEKEME